MAQWSKTEISKIHDLFQVKFRNCTNLQNAMFSNGDFRNRCVKMILVMVWPANAKNLKFYTHLYHARKLDNFRLRAKFLFSWLGKLAHYLSWQDEQAQLNFGFSEAKLKKSEITDFLSGEISKWCKLAKIASKWVPMHSLQDSTSFRCQNFDNRSLRAYFICKSRISWKWPYWKKSILL